MNTDEMNLQEWRNVPAPASLRARLGSKQRTPRNRFFVLATSAAMVALLLTFLAIRPNPALAAIHRIDAKLQSASTLLIETEVGSQMKGGPGRGVSIIAHGRFRRDGLRGLRAYKGPEGKWYYDPADQSVKQSQPYESTTVYYPESFSLASLTGDYEQDDVEDLGDQTRNGQVLRRYQIRDGRSITDIWIDIHTDLPVELEQQSLTDADDFQICRFYFGVQIDASVMTPEALSAPLDQLLDQNPS